MPSRTLTLTIDRLSYGPAGVGRADGKAVFVPGTVPGDEVEVALDEEKKTYATGSVMALRHPSPHRRLPPCPYVQRCGGCPWQQVAYAEQLRAKETLVREHMRRIGGLTDPPVLPIIPSPQEWHYRHRIRLRAEDNARLGFYQASSHELVEIESCLIAGENVADHLRVVRAWLASLRTPVRRVELVTGEPARGPASPGVVLVGNAEGAFDPEDEIACRHFLATYPHVGLVLFGRGWRRTWGETQTSCDLGIEGLTLTVSQGAFTQVNLAANRALIAALLRLSDAQKEQRVIELYCGAGNLSLPLARRVRSLIGIEQDRTAVADARANAARAGLTNTRFVCAPARVGVRDLRRAGVQGDVVVLDPPRAGAAEVIDEVPRLGAQMVIYVSCDPATLARDLRRLHAHGYQVRALQPLDLFPHTYHVETIAVSVLTC
ncbi:MAG: 23S rRNA (uracil(1939)-C(5))-methyltransferase RlmD [Deltaproteobacteria bacterium]|nr:23S rRNA (uracil(1939)-C(5))-methyltransferase RlmD [Deltaproteobacteria bacterium]